MSRHMAANGIATVSKQGFTLVELVMTLVIVAILAVFAVSRLDFKSTFDQRSYHDKLKAGLQFARKAAVAQRRYVCVAAAANVVTFTIDANVPESTPIPFGGTCPFANPLSLPSPDRTCAVAAPNTICAPSGVTLTPSSASFQFDAKGASSLAVAATFASTGPFTITVEPETGYVH
jgi:MSHA pilin protein MshC